MHFQWKFEGSVGTGRGPNPDQGSSGGQPPPNEPNVNPEPPAQNPGDEASSQLPPESRSPSGDNEGDGNTESDGIPFPLRSNENANDNPCTNKPSSLPSDGRSTSISDAMSTEPVGSTLAQGQPLSNTTFAANKRPGEPEVVADATPPKKFRFLPSLPSWLGFRSKPQKIMVNGNDQPQPSNSNANENKGSENIPAPADNTQNDAAATCPDGHSNENKGSENIPAPADNTQNDAAATSPDGHSNENKGSENIPVPADNTQNDAAATSTDGHFKILDPNITIHPPLEAINEKIKKGCYYAHDLILCHREHGSVQFHGVVNLQTLGEVTDFSRIANFRPGAIEVHTSMIGYEMTVTLFNISRRGFAQQVGLETVTNKELTDIVIALGKLAHAIDSNYNEEHQMWKLRYPKKTELSTMDKKVTIDDGKSPKNKDNDDDPVDISNMFT